MEFFELRKLVKEGEHSQLEFKRKARHPDKIARELVAFANSEGGTLLVGIDDDGSIYGSKTAGEDEFVLRRYIQQHISPALPYQLEKISVSSRHEVLAFLVEPSCRKPHSLKMEDGRWRAFVRVEDMSVQASYEMKQLLRLQRRSKGVSIAFGEAEARLLQYLEELPHITLDETRKLLNISRRRASSLLVLLVRAGLLRIQPTRRGDYFCLSQEAFE
ncbi:MAG: ATP-binding protein [Bacteroidetes bacterium]|nr:MAG: ATP-binding protein [Bacteroidota bacterium]